METKIKINDRILNKEKSLIFLLKQVYLREYQNVSVTIRHKMPTFEQWLSQNGLFDKTKIDSNGVVLNNG